MKKRKLLNFVDLESIKPGEEDHSIEYTQAIQPPFYLHQKASSSKSSRKEKFAFEAVDLYLLLN